MYVVLRFVGGDETSDEVLTKLGSKLNGELPGSYKGLDRVRGRFSADVCSDCKPAELSAAIAAYLRKSEAVVRSALIQNIKLELDVAVEPQDVAGQVYLSIAFGPELLKALSDLQIQLVITSYTP